jgi:hypothetical protein
MYSTFKLTVPFQVALKLDPEAEITKYGRTFPGPLTEIEVKHKINIYCNILVFFQLVKNY